MGSMLRKLWRNERGMSFVFVGLGFMALLSATTLAIDVGMFMTARSEAQNSADAGALSGAVALAFDSFSDRTPSGPAVQSSRAAALANPVIGKEVSIIPEDVTFPASLDADSDEGDGASTPWIRVKIFRTGSRGNPVSTLLGGLYGMPTVDIGATATAEASPANAMTCLKPFTIPDKWIEMQDPPWDPDDTFEAYDKKGNPLPNPDIYIPTSSTEVGTGYNSERDRGTRLMIRAGTGANISPSFYFSLALGGLTGGDAYRWNIANCNTTVMTYGELMTSEPGDMVGPTTKGAEDLILLDPAAYWDTSKNKVVSTMSPSPRVFAIPVYDPVYYDSGKRTGRGVDLKAANFIGFFIEDVVGNSIYGRITPIGGLMTGAGGPAPIGGFPMAIRLVQ